MVLRGGGCSGGCLSVEVAVCGSHKGLTHVEYIYNNTDFLVQSCYIYNYTENIVQALPLLLIIGG